MTGFFGWTARDFTRSEDGTYAGEEAKGNTVFCETAGFDWSDYFNPGDGVTISGASAEGNNKTAVVREIEDGALRFYENCFVTGGGSQSVTVKRAVPDMDFLCENENRLWGCKGDTIYACKLGDIFNWNVFDGVATDSYAADVASTGDFTACASYLGYPCFFKEEHIYKVYGDRPRWEAPAWGWRGEAGGALPSRGNSFFIYPQAGRRFIRAGCRKALPPLLAV